MFFSSFLQDVRTTPRQKMASTEQTRTSFKVGSRKSQLALVQTRRVISMLQEKFPEFTFEIVSMTTAGDHVLDKALSKIGDKSLFTKELEVALIAGKVDFVVHSLKDVPTELPPGLTVGAICKRDDPRDALVLKAGSGANSLSTLPPGSVLGTSSMRRTAQLKKLYPHLIVYDVRGNLNTRLKKLDEEGKFDALLLAAAGLERLGWNHRVSQVLESSKLMYAVGQGALCVECRIDDLKTVELLSTLADPKTVIESIAERSFLRYLEGGCSAPVAVRCDLIGDELTLQGGVYSVDGNDEVSGEVSCQHEGFKELEKKNVDMNASRSQEFVGIYIPTIPSVIQEVAQSLGIKLAGQLKETGATPLLKEAKKLAAENVLKEREAKERLKQSKIVE